MVIVIYKPHPDDGLRRLRGCAAARYMRWYKYKRYN